MPSTRDIGGSDAAKPGLADPSLDERIHQQRYQPRIPRAVLKEPMKRSDVEARTRVPHSLLPVLAISLLAQTFPGATYVVFTVV